MATYSYNPHNCMDGSINQMRFELGDTVTEEEGMPSLLSDEEYNAIITANPGKWKRAKLICLEAIMMKLSYEVDTSVDGLSYSLNQRAERWQKMYDKLKNELKASVPSADAVLPPSMTKKPCYFYTDMHMNIRKV